MSDFLEDPATYMLIARVRAMNESVKVAREEGREGTVYEDHSMRVFIENGEEMIQAKAVRVPFRMMPS